MKMGDIVMITLAQYGISIVGIFICDDTERYGEDPNGDKILTHAHVMRDGGIYSTPLDLLEVINESR